MPMIETYEEFCLRMAQEVVTVVSPWVTELPLDYCLRLRKTGLLTDTEQVAVERRLGVHGYKNLGLG